jgi:hypothetical protein
VFRRDHPHRPPAHVQHPEALADATAQLKPILSEIYPDGYETRQGTTDPRACLSVIATGKAGFDGMLGRLGA